MFNPSLSPHDYALLSVARGRNVGFTRATSQAAADRYALLDAVREVSRSHSTQNPGTPPTRSAA